MKNHFKTLFLTAIFTVLLFGNAVYAESSFNGVSDDPQAGREQGYSEETDTDELSSISLYSLTDSLKTTSAYTLKTYTHNSAFTDCDLINGIDVSYWNGDIDWDKVAADGIEYAIIRVGYRGYSSGTLVTDTCFEQNIKGALDAGIKVGVYFFTQAITKSEAKAEAKYVINAISGYDVELPIVIDYEYAADSSGNIGRLYEAKLSASAATNVCAAFCDTVEDAGYIGMVYANKSTLSNCLDADTLSDKYYIWLANYTTKTTYSGEYSFWQYSSEGTVDGIGGNVDCNFWYNDGLLVRKKIPSTKITLSVKSKSLLIGKSFTLKTTLSPSDSTDSVRFESSKPYVAYVTNSGYIKGISKGTTTITVTSTSGVTAKCKVTVNEDLSKYEILSISNRAYTGNKIKPSVTVQRQSKTATSGKTTANLNLRSGPSTGYSVLATIPSGKKVTILGTATVSGTKWYAVSVTISGVKYKGYCSGNYLKVTKTYKTLTKGTDYTVKYSNNKSIGKATVTVAGIEGKASGTLKTTFKIIPGKIKELKTTKVGKTTVKIKWSKRTATGYQIYRKTGKNGKYKLIKTIKKNSTLSFKNTGLKKNTTYYYKVRAYKVVNGKTYYGAFSKALKVTTKKK